MKSFETRMLVVIALIALCKFWAPFSDRWVETLPAHADAVVAMADE